MNPDDQPHPIRRALQWYGVGLQFDDLKAISVKARAEGEVVRQYEDCTIYRIEWEGAVMYPVMEGPIIKTFYRKGYL